MYFWKIEKLKEQIKNEKFTEKDRFSYAFIYVVLCAIVNEVMMLLPLENGNIWDLINSVAYIIVIVIGTLCAFKANGSNDGVDFLGRYFSIGFVVGIRFLVFAIPLFILLFVYYFYAYEDDEDIPSSFIDVVPFIIWHIAIFWRICKHIQQVNLKTELSSVDT